jgi:hypothetical protein
MNPEFVVFGIVAVIEVYYWFFWFPKNKHSVKEYKDWKYYNDQVWKKGIGVK